MDTGTALGTCPVEADIARSACGLICYWLTGTVHACLAIGTSGAGRWWLGLVLLFPLLVLASFLCVDIVSQQGGAEAECREHCQTAPTREVIGQPPHNGVKP
jgi:hypothetical protein